MEVRMKAYVCLILLLVGITLFAQPNAIPEESAVLQLQQQWLDASQKGNLEALSQIIDDSFIGSAPNNHIINKQSLLPPSGSNPTFTNTHFESLNAKVVDNTAVVFGSMITTGDATALRCTMVYAKRAGAWKMIAAQLVPVSETKDAGQP
jgi:Domain of unknown function (DUF4440)